MVCLYFQVYQVASTHWWVFDISFRKLTCHTHKETNQLRQQKWTKCENYEAWSGLQPSEGAKKVIFTACYLSKLKLAFTSPNVISTSPQNFWWAELISQFFSESWILQNTSLAPLCKLRTEFTSAVAKSTSPRLSDTTCFARCFPQFMEQFSSLIIFSVM